MDVGAENGIIKLIKTAHDFNPIEVGGAIYFIEASPSGYREYIKTGLLD